MNSTSKTALITGSGKNIGRGIAIGLAQEGFNIVVNGVANEAAVQKTVSDIKSLGVEAIGVMADIGDPGGLSGLIKDAMDTFGGVDVLVNNAAIRPSAGFIEMSDEDWMRVMNVNFGSVHGLSKATPYCPAWSNGAMAELSISAVCTRCAAMSGAPMYRHPSMRSGD